MLAEAEQFREESQDLYELLKKVEPARFAEPTLFKGWTVNDILAHLHYFNYMAELSLNHEDRFVREYAVLREARDKGETIRQATDRLLNHLHGAALLEAWHDFFPKLAAEFGKSDPKKRVKWGGPDMSVRSSATARLMETWSHAQAIYDLFGVRRQNKDRIKGIAVLGINTFRWTFINRGLPIPGEPPRVRLTAPSGEIWEWNEASSTGLVEGPAEEFCQVVTQTRNLKDTQLKVSGPVAVAWMEIAQCFAGKPEDPPAPGARRMSAAPAARA